MPSARRVVGNVEEGRADDRDAASGEKPAGGTAKAFPISRADLGLGGDLRGEVVLAGNVALRVELLLAGDVELGEVGAAEGDALGPLGGVEVHPLLEVGGEVVLLVGLAVGVLPKTMMVAFFGNSIMNAFQGEFVTAAVMAALAIVVAIAIALIVRRFARRDDKDAKSEE